MSLADTARRLAASVVLSGRQRLELAALDIEEEVVRAGNAVALMLVVAVFSTLALASLAAAVVVLLWEHSHFVALLGSFALFSAVAAVVARSLLTALRAKPPFLRATLDELERDAPCVEEQQA
jgi:uncharacterized membrane protein YqjE